MKRVEFTTIGGRLVSIWIVEVAAVLSRLSPQEAVIFVTGNDDGFIVKGSYEEVIKKIERVENPYHDSPDPYRNAL